MVTGADCEGVDAARGLGVMSRSGVPLDARVRTGATRTGRTFGDRANSATHTRNGSTYTGGTGASAMASRARFLACDEVAR